MCLLDLVNNIYCIILQQPHTHTQKNKTKQKQQKAEEKKINNRQCVQSYEDDLDRFISLIDYCSIKKNYNNNNNILLLLYNNI